MSETAIPEASRGELVVSDAVVRKGRRVKLDMAMQAVVDGMSATDYMQAMEMYCRDLPENEHHAYLVTRSQAISWLRKGRLAWHKQQARSRREMYAESRARLDKIYRTALLRRDTSLVLATQKHIDDIQGITGESVKEQDNSAEAGAIRRIDDAIARIAQALHAVGHDGTPGSEEDTVIVKTGVGGNEELLGSDPESSDLEL